MDTNGKRISRNVVQKTAERVRKIVKGGKIAGKVRRDALMRQAVDAIEGEILKDPQGFARYLVSRMLWDILGDFAVRA